MKKLRFTKIFLLLTILSGLFIYFSLKPVFAAIKIYPPLPSSSGTLQCNSPKEDPWRAWTTPRREGPEGEAVCIPVEMPTGKDLPYLLGFFEGGEFIDGTLPRLTPPGKELDYLWENLSSGWEENWIEAEKEGFLSEACGRDRSYWKLDTSDIFGLINSSFTLHTYLTKRPGVEEEGLVGDICLLDPPINEPPKLDIGITCVNPPCPPPSTGPGPRIPYLEGIKKFGRTKHGLTEEMHGYANNMIDYNKGVYQVFIPPGKKLKSEIFGKGEILGMEYEYRRSGTVECGENFVERSLSRPGHTIFEILGCFEDESPWSF